MPKLTELGELDYSLVIFEFVSDPDDTNAPTILTFYLIDRDVGCPKQSLTFVLEVTCPKKKLLFNYGKVEFVKFFLGRPLSPVWDSPDSGSIK